jgi:cephalosporin hydroxylase
MELELMPIPEPSPAEPGTSTLHRFLRHNTEIGGRKLRKYSNYIELYERVLSNFIGTRPRILEIGVQHGGSLRMWKEYFSGNVEIFGVDILPECKKFEEPNIHIFIGDQSDDNFLEELSNNIGSVNVIVDDGSHVCSHQIATFEKLFYRNLLPEGYYIVEDCHSSYMVEYGGGLRRKGTFIEYAKKLCDAVNAWHAGDYRLPVTLASKWIRRITFESSLVMVEKSEMDGPPSVTSGATEIDTQNIFSDDLYGRLLSRLRSYPSLRFMVRNNPFFWRMMRRVVGKKKGQQPEG